MFVLLAGRWRCVHILCHVLNLDLRTTCWMMEVHKVHLMILDHMLNLDKETTHWLRQVHMVVSPPITHFLFVQGIQTGNSQACPLLRDLVHPLYKPYCHSLQKLHYTLLRFCQLDTARLVSVDTDAVYYVGTCPLSHLPNAPWWLQCSMLFEVMLICRMLISSTWVYGCQILPRQDLWPGGCWEGQWRLHKNLAYLVRPCW